MRHKILFLSFFSIHEQMQNPFLTHSKEIIHGQDLVLE
jgi:hypothetical protein